MIAFKPLDSAAEWEWFKRRTHVILCEDMCGIVAVRDGDILAVCVADSFTLVACNVHLAIDNPIVLRHGFLESICAWLYVDNNRKTLVGLVPDLNSKALKLNDHIGFREVARIPNVISDEVGYVVMQMDKEDCRWIPEADRRAA